MGRYWLCSLTPATETPPSRQNDARPLGLAKPPLPCHTLGNRSETEHAADVDVTPRNPDAHFCSLLAHKVACDLRDAGWDFERVTTDNGSEFRNARFDAAIEHLGATHTLIRPGRPQSNGFVERVQRTILDECWKPAFARYLVPKYMGLRRELERYLVEYNFDRTHRGRLTQGRTPAEVLGAAKMWR